MVRICGRAWMRSCRRLDAYSPLALSANVPFPLNTLLVMRHPEGGWGAAPCPRLLHRTRMQTGLRFLRPPSPLMKRVARKERHGHSFFGVRIDDGFGRTIRSRLHSRRCLTLRAFCRGTAGLRVQRPSLTLRLLLAPALWRDRRDCRGFRSLRLRRLRASYHKFLAAYEACLRKLLGAAVPWGFPCG